MYICTYTYTYVYLFLNLYLYPYIYIYIYMSMYLSIYLCISISIYIYIYMSFSMCIYIYIYIYIHIHGKEDAAYGEVVEPYVVLFSDMVSSKGTSLRRSSRVRFPGRTHMLGETRPLSKGCWPASEQTRARSEPLSDVVCIHSCICMGIHVCYMYA